MKDKVLGELKNVFKPEFLNRVDSTVVFRSLSKENIRAIVDLELRKVEKQLLAKGTTIEVTLEEPANWVEPARPVPPKAMGSPKLTGMAVAVVVSKVAAMLPV